MDKYYVATWQELFSICQIKIKHSNIYYNSTVISDNITTRIQVKVAVFLDFTEKLIGLQKLGYTVRKSRK